MFEGYNLNELKGQWYTMLCGGRVCYPRQKNIFLAHISGHNHNWLLHWFVPCYLQNHALLWQDNWMRFNVEMNGNSWCVCWTSNREVFCISLHLWYWHKVYCSLYSVFTYLSIYLQVIIFAKSKHKIKMAINNKVRKECQWFIGINDINVQNT